MSSIPSTKKVLLTGATGYIGGSVLHRLLASSEAALDSYHSPISVLIRGEDRIPKLKGKYGERISCILFSSLDDTDFVTQVAAQHDVIINAGSGFHPQSAEAMVRGLAKRKQETGNEVWMINTSGCSNISDLPITQQPFPDRELVDSDAPAVFAFEKTVNELDWYPQRAAELIVLETAEQLGVHAVSVQAPGIFGLGEGLFQTAGYIIPTLVQYALGKGYGFSLGAGTGTFDIVHVSDLADFYSLLLRHILELNTSSISTGRSGILFPTHGRMKVTDIMKDCLDGVFKAGLLPLSTGPKKPEIREISLEEAAAFTGGSKVIAERAWAGHKNTKGVVGKEVLGWRPSRGREEFLQDIEDEIVALS